MRVGGLRALAARVEQLEASRSSRVSTDEIVRILQAGRLRAATWTADEPRSEVQIAEARQRLWARLAT